MTHRRLSSFGANSVELRAALAAEHTFDHAERMTEYGESGGDDPRPEHGGSRGDDPRPGEPLGARYLGPDFSKLSGAAQFRGPDFSKLVGAQFRFPDYSKLIGATQFGGPDLSKLVGAQFRIPDYSKLVAAQFQGPDLAKLVAAQFRGPDLAKLVAAQFRGPDLAKLVGAQFRLPDYSKLVGTQFRIPNYSKLVGAQFRGPDFSRLIGGPDFGKFIGEVLAKQVDAAAKLLDELANYTGAESAGTHAALSLDSLPWVAFAWALAWLTQFYLTSVDEAGNYVLDQDQAHLLFDAVQIISMAWATKTGTAILIKKIRRR